MDEVDGNTASPNGPFSAVQAQRILASCADIHRRMSELESYLWQADQIDAFSSHTADLEPVERKMVQDFFARIRTTMQDLLDANDISIAAKPISLRWELITGLAFLQVVLSDISPSTLRGYGEVTSEGRIAARRMQDELRRVVEELSRYLQQKTGTDFLSRMQRLESSIPDLTKSLQAIEEIVTRRSLIEFYPQIRQILERLENSSFQIGIFGRVNTGKSLLLNKLIDQDVLPVGITPITAVPVRLTWGDPATAVVDLATGGRRTIDLSELSEYASEEKNASNRRHVARIEVRIPAEKLRSRVTFVDTPGIGALARQGSRETFAYLPQCDLGIVLIDASATIHEEDIRLIQLLLDAGISVQILLSKTDLLNSADQKRMLDYVDDQIQNLYGRTVPLFAVSAANGQERPLNRWYELEIAPLQSQNQELVNASLRRKVALLRNSLIETLELQLGSVGGYSSDVIKQMQQGLASADDALRRGESLSIQKEPLELPRLLSATLRQAAEEIGSPRNVFANDGLLLRRFIEDALCARGDSAAKLARQTRSELVNALRFLKEVSGLEWLDETAVEKVEPENLPTPNWVILQNQRAQWRPWWTLLGTTIAKRWVYRRLKNSHQAELDGVFVSHDLQISHWIRSHLVQLKTAFEAQVAPLRELLRQSRTSAKATGFNDRLQLQRDIQALRGEKSAMTSPLVTAVGA